MSQKYGTSFVGSEEISDNLYKLILNGKVKNSPAPELTEKIVKKHTKSFLAENKSTIEKLAEGLKTK